MKAWAWGVPGLFLPLWLPGIPGKFALLVTLLALLVWLFCQSSRAVFFLLGLAWTSIHVQQRLDNRVVSPPVGPIAVHGKVISLPVQRGDMLEFRFLVGESEGKLDLEGRLLIVRWYRNYPGVNAGESWQLNLRIKPARGRVNFQGPDRERWYFSQGISALGIVRNNGNRKTAPASRWDISHQRQRNRDDISRIVDDHPSRPLVLALALADRSEIPARSWQRFRLTGTSHLLAISGMHIGLAAVIGYWLGRVALVFMPAIVLLKIGNFTTIFSSVSVAFVYALMAGLGTSTQRALIMLLVFMLLKLTLRSTRPWTGLLLALFGVLVFNPMAPLEAGFWFSFIAVTVLLATFAPRSGQRHWLFTLLLAQAAVTAVMLPLGMLFFQKVTFLGLISNLAAIPWVSFVAVPAILLGVLAIPLGDPVAPFLLLMAAESLRYLDALLGLIEQLGAGSWLEVEAPLVIPVVLAALGAMLLLVPGQLTFRYLGILLVIPLCLPGHRQKGHLELEMLDVGQGLAVVIRGGGRQMLYDTGPGDARSWSLVASTLIPAMGGKKPDLVLVSHGDLDHAGGMTEVGKHYPASTMLASLRDLPDGVSRCNDSRAWSWGDIEFTILHPSRGLPYLGNDSSCVVSVSFAGVGALLTGDISSNIEKRLLIQGVGDHNILLAPHHGSKSSSSHEFVNAVNPDWALVSTAYQNSFDFPDPSVQARYAARNIPLLNTAGCGAIRLTVNILGEIDLQSARNFRSPIWRWRADANCP